MPRLVSPIPPYLSVEKAVEKIRSGSHVFVGSGCAEPELLVQGLMRRAPELHDVEILHLLTAGTAPYTEEPFRQAFRHNAFFIGPNVRRAVLQGRADYTPCFLHEIPSMIRSGRIPIDAALIQTTPPDSQGYASLGIAVDIVKAAVETARLVIAQANPRMPWTHGKSLLAPQEIDAWVLGETPLLELPPAPDAPEAREIARHVSLLIENGATLQMGIGAIPDAVLSALTDKKDLGIHTEMFSDGLIPLMEKGVVTNRLKGIHPGKTIASFCMGTRRLYQFINRNPHMEFHPSDYVNDPWVIAQNRKMTSINSALQIDLTGQVCADSIGHRFFSGFGGQVDFIRGAARSPGGKAIIALPSTAKKGTVSRITASLDPGAGVVTSRADVDFVVTEYGIASLKGRSIRERALALIQIAHPKFREELMRQAKELAFVDPDQVPWPENPSLYPVELETHWKLQDGTPVHIRPLKASDERSLRDFFYSHSDRTVHMRYGLPLKNLTPKQIQDFVTLDYREKMALGAFLRQGRASTLIGVARYYLDPSTRMAEMAMTIHDHYQGRGLGTFLLRQLRRTAESRGVAGFTAKVLVENTPMIRLFSQMGRPLLQHRNNGTVELSFRF